VQVLSIFLLLYILFLNINLLYDNIYKLAFIIPLSVSKITFLDEAYANVHKGIIYFILKVLFFTWFHFFDLTEISDFLENLDNDKAYIVSFELIFDWLAHESRDPGLV